jgi:hypothetical protein
LYKRSIKTHKQKWKNPPINIHATLYITKTRRKERNGVCTSGLLANLTVKTWTVNHDWITETEKDL